MAASRLRHEDDEARRVAQEARPGAGLAAAAEVKIPPGRSDDRRPGILADHQPAQGLGPFEALRQRAVEPERQAVGPQIAVDREAAAGRERDPGAADRAVLRGELRRLAEEHV